MQIKVKKTYFFLKHATWICAQCCLFCFFVVDYSSAVATDEIFRRSFSIHFKTTIASFMFCFGHFLVANALFFFRFRSLRCSFQFRLRCSFHHLFNDDNNQSLFCWFCHFTFLCLLANPYGLSNPIRNCIQMIFSGFCIFELSFENWLFYCWKFLHGIGYTVKTVFYCWYTYMKTFSFYKYKLQRIFITASIQIFGMISLNDH